MDFSAPADGLAPPLREVAHSLLQRSANGGAWTYEVAADRLRWSPAVYEIHGVAAHEYQPTLSSAMAFLLPESRCALEAELARTLAQGGGWDLELELTTANGRRRWVHSVCQAVVEQGRVVGLAGCLIDIHARRSVEIERERLRERVRYHLRHDVMSGLPNRRQLETEIAARVMTARERGASGWVLYLDLARFKLVNEHCGHAAGDRLIREISNVLRGALEPQEMLAHVGGDEFALITGEPSPAVAVRRAQALIDAVDAFRFHCGGRRFHLGLAVGAAAIDAQVAGAGEALSRAETACHLARRQGGNQVILYRRGDALVAQAHDDMDWADEIQRALDENRLELFAQRIVCLGTEGGHPAYEILLRLRARDGREVLPAQFLPAVRRYGLMAAVDRRVVEMVLSYWRAGLIHPQRCDHVTVNLSGPSLCDSAFLGFLLPALVRSGIPPSLLRFEITESEAFSNMHDAQEAMARLRELGFGVLLDDFGNGFTSFNYLRTLRVQGLKIDASFVRELHRDRFNQAIVASICQVCEQLHLEVIAEGVEDAATLERVRQLGVGYGQGWLFHRPEPLAAVFGAQSVNPAA